MNLLDESQLKKLDSHKYRSNGRSLTEPAFQVFWNKLILYFPTSIAPNALTITGLILNIFSTLILLYYSPDGASQIPSLPLVFAAISLFIYQTLDALDGKQARRTNSSSPLGELFDHGCDAFSTVFVSLGTCVAIGLGKYPYLLLLEVLTSILLFYMAQWQCYVTGTLEFGTLDVTEAQIIVMIIYLISAVFGVNVWQVKPIPFLSLELKHLQVAGMLIPALWMFFRFLTTIMRDGVGKNGTTVANTSVVFPCFPIGFVMSLAVMTATRRKSHLFLHNPCLFLISFGMVASKLTNKLVIGHMTKSEINFFDSIYFGPLTIFLNQHFDCPIREDYLLWAVCAYSTFDAIKYGVMVCRQIAEYLKIYVFVLGPRQGVSSGASTSSNNNNQSRIVSSDKWRQQASNSYSWRPRQTHS